MHACATTYINSFNPIDVCGWWTSITDLQAIVAVTIGGILVLAVMKRCKPENSAMRNNNRKIFEYRPYAAVWVQKFEGLKFRIFAETSLLLNFHRFKFLQICYVCNYHVLFGLILRCYSWISEQAMAKENNTQLEFLCNGHWLDKSNEGEPYSSLPCPATAHFAWA